MAFMGMTQTLQRPRNFRRSQLPNGFSTNLFLSRRRTRVPAIAEQGAARRSSLNLAQIGVKVTLEPIKSGKFLASVAAGEQGMFMLGWGADYPDPTNFYDFHFTGASKNFGDVYPDLVDAIHAAGQVADPTERTKLYSKVAELVKQHVRIVPVAHGTNGIAYKATVDGAQASPLADEQFNLMSVPGQDQLNFIQNGEPIRLYCADQTDGETCVPATTSLTRSTGTSPNNGARVAAADSYQVGGPTEWTFSLNKNAKFSDGTPMDANDVVETFVVMWDV